MHLYVDRNSSDDRRQVYIEESGSETISLLKIRFYDESRRQLSLDLYLDFYVTNGQNQYSSQRSDAISSSLFHFTVYVK